MCNWSDQDNYLMFTYLAQWYQCKKATLAFNLSKHFILSTSQTLKYRSNGEHSLQRKKKNRKNNFFTNSFSKKKLNSWCCWGKSLTLLRKMKMSKTMLAMILLQKNSLITGNTYKEKEKKPNFHSPESIRPSEKPLKMTYFCSKTKFFVFSLLSVRFGRTLKLQ